MFRTVVSDSFVTELMIKVPLRGNSRAAMDSGCIDGPLPGGGLYPNPHLNAPTYIVHLSLLLSLYFRVAEPRRG